jgi:hypothetical protein
MTLSERLTIALLVIAGLCAVAIAVAPYIMGQYL